MPRHQYKEQVILYSIFLLTLALPSCSSPQSFKLANTAVQEFHNKYNNEQYLEIYKQSDEMFREKGEAEAVAFFRKIGEKLGKAGKTKQIGWHINFSTMGTTVTVSYDTEFSKGKGNETFGFIIKNGVARLTTYRINSALLQE